MEQITTYQITKELWRNYNRKLAKFRQNSGIGGKGKPCALLDYMVSGINLQELGLRVAVLNRQEAASYLGISVRVLDKLSPRVNPKIGYIRLTDDGDKRFPVSLLDAYLERCIEAQVPQHLLRQERYG